MSTQSNTYPWVITPLPPPRPPRNMQEDETNPYRVTLAPQNTPQPQSFQEFYDSLSNNDPPLSDADNSRVKSDIGIQPHLNYNYARSYNPYRAWNTMNDPYISSERTPYMNSSYTGVSGGPYHYSLTQIQNQPSSGSLPSEDDRKNADPFNRPDEKMDTRT